MLKRLTLVRLNLWLLNQIIFGGRSLELDQNQDLHRLQKKLFQFLFLPAEWLFALELRPDIWATTSNEYLPTQTLIPTTHHF